LIMPLLTPLQSEILWSFITIGYGIWKERHFVALSTAITNLAGFLMVLATFDLPDYIPWLLLMYVGLGALAAYTRNYALMDLAGCKPYGSLTLALGLYEMGFLAPLALLGRIYEGLGTEAATIIVAWIILAIASHLIMHKLMGKKDERKPF
jgi:hypothetical protein